MTKKNIIRLSIAFLFIVCVGIAIYVFRPKPVQVALVNVPDFIATRMAQSADEKNVSLSIVTEIDELENFDAMIAFGMGLKWTEEDRAQIKKIGQEKGLKFLTYMAPNPDNLISNIDSLHVDKILNYISNGGTRNFCSAFNYLRQEVLGKSLRSGDVAEPIEYGQDLLFTDEDPDLAFSSVSDFQEYYNKHGYRKECPRVAVVTGIAGPFGSSREYLDEIIGALEDHGLNVYPISAIEKRFEFLSEINPELIIYFPHGRFGAEPAIKWLKERNIPLLCPTLVNDSYEKWISDPQGMFGGYLSQSVVTPELDGAIEPFALVTLRENEQGFKEFHVVPERIEDFCSLVKRYIHLREVPNKDKRIAIFYYKGPGQNSLIAQGIEVVPSLYNLLRYLQKEGYNVAGLPATETEFRRDLMTRGALYNSYAKGNRQMMLHSGWPAFVPTDLFAEWIEDTMPAATQDSIKGRYGAVPGVDLTMRQGDSDGIAVTRIEYGNIALLPQSGPGRGEVDFKMVHGSTSIPAYPYIASYLWARNGFKADALVHFGTHGSLEFIPGKQVALSNYDYTDRLVRDLPHVYYYTTANVGEAMIAKRRSYGQIVSYLAPPFIDTELDKETKPLHDLVDRYLSQEQDNTALSLQIKQLVLKSGYHRDLKLDSVKNTPYSRTEIELVGNFIDELATTKIVGGMYTMGVPFSQKKITSSVRLLSVDPIAYGLSQIDKARGKVTDQQIKNESYFNSHYLRPADRFVASIQQRGMKSPEKLLADLGVSSAEIARVDAFLSKQKEQSSSMGHPMGMAMSGKMPKNMMAASSTKSPAGHSSAMGAKHGRKAMPTEDPQLTLLVEGVSLLRRAIAQIPYYTEMLQQSPQLEMVAFHQALRGGYTAPSPGGDYIAGPAVLPTGRNLYAIDPEQTPSKKAWEHGKQLADALIADYKYRHQDSLPRKVSFSLWSSSFIESEGTTIAEIMALLGVEPVRDRRDKVIDVRVIPIKELGRPRIDVVIQTSGQLRDIAASRLFLLQKAMDLVAQTQDGSQPNAIAQGRIDAERVLLEHGVPPEQARKLSGKRIFGGLNGAYGTGIQEMVESGDRWETEDEIADVYLNNMGAIYGDQELWGDTAAGLFEAALQNTDAVVQPRQSNTWGALSLDHVYEFMGGLTLSVRKVTGKDPEGYMSDLRNRNRVKNQEIKQAIGVEARTTILNPTYVREQIKEGAGAADALDETIRNTYAWNVMKPSAIDDELWDGIYDMYVVDKHGLGTVEFFERNNPAALQDLTAAMMETIRKGYWEATPEQRKQIAELHASSLSEAGAGCSGMVCDNAKLREAIRKDLSPQLLAKYDRSLEKALKPQTDGQKEQRLTKDSDKAKQRQKSSASSPLLKSGPTTWALVAGGVVVVLLIVLLIYYRRKRTSK